MIKIIRESEKDATLTARGSMSMLKSEETGRKRIGINYQGYNPIKAVNQPICRYSLNILNWGNEFVQIQCLNLLKHYFNK